MRTLALVIGACAALGVASAARADADYYSGTLADVAGSGPLVNGDPFVLGFSYNLSDLSAAIQPTSIHDSDVIYTGPITVNFDNGVLFGTGQNSTLEVVHGGGGTNEPYYSLTFDVGLDSGGVEFQSKYLPYGLLPFYPGPFVMDNGLVQVGNDTAYLNGSEGPAPEPSTWALMTVGLGGIGLMLRRKSRKNPTIHHTTCGHTTQYVG